LKWFKRQHQESVTAEALTVFLLKQTLNIVKDASQTLREDPDTHHLSKPEVEEELVFFFVFALDYYWTTQPTRTRQEQRIFREAFLVHFRNVGKLHTFEERLITYGQIATEKKSINDMLWAITLKLCGFCGVSSDFSILMILVPDLFGKALDTALALKSVSLVNR